MIYKLKNVDDELDQTLVDTAVIAFNRCLVALRDEQDPKELVEQLGRNIRRFYTIWELYKNKKDNQALTKEEFEAKLRGLVDLFSSVSGVR